MGPRLVAEAPRVRFIATVVFTAPCLIRREICPGLYARQIHLQGLLEALCNGGGAALPVGRAGSVEEFRGGFTGELVQIVLQLDRL